MVTTPTPRRRAPASFALLALLLLDAAGPTPPGPPKPDQAADRARAALKSGGFPWYDPASDDVRSLRLPPDPTPDPSRASSTAGTGGGWSFWGFQTVWDALVFLLFVAALIALAILVARYWKRFEPAPDAVRDVEPEPAAPGGGEVLPAALRPVALGGDLWAEADRRRRAGDLAGAVVCLFAHQLLSLSRLGLVRLVPGRTGRQLQRSVADRDFQAMVLPTLRQFEAVYYGHRAVPPADFALVWAAAESFQRRLAEQGSR